MRTLSVARCWLLFAFATTTIAISACSRHPAPQPSAPAPVSTPAPLRAVADPALAALLAERRMNGTIAVLRAGESEVRCADVALCERRFVPASTFKIPNSLIGLETGVIADADFVIGWDGVTRSFPAWNRDHSLRTAIAVSCVPYYQELARRVGLTRMRAWVEQLGFGNRRVGEVVDRFWLDGPLAISPLEQLAFLSALAQGKLPISERTRRIVEDLLVLEQKGDATLRGKTGWGSPNTPDELGWFVGWVEQRGARAYVAVLLLPAPDREEAAFLALRRAVAERALAELGLW